MTLNNVNISLISADNEISPSTTRWPLYWAHTPVMADFECLLESITGIDSGYLLCFSESLDTIRKIFLHEAIMKRIKHCGLMPLFLYQEEEP